MSPLWTACGKFSARRFIVEDVPVSGRVVTYAIGFTAVAVGVYLVVSGLMNVRYLELNLF